MCVFFKKIRHLVERVTLHMHKNIILRPNKRIVREGNSILGAPTFPSKQCKKIVHARMLLPLSLSTVVDPFLYF